MVSFEDECGTRFLDGIIEEGTTITKLLSHVDLIPVEKHIEKKYYAETGRRFCFDVGLMVRLVVVKSFRDLSFRKTLYSLTYEDCHYLRVPEIDGEFRIPSPSAFHAFVKYRLGEEGFRKIMELVGIQLVKSVGNAQEAIIDSTPLEASRYNPYALYNPLSAGHLSTIIFFILGAQKPQYLSEFIIQICNPLNSLSSIHN